MARFDVSRTVVREATKIRESMGLVEMRRKSGLRVRPMSEWSLSDPHIIRWRLAGPEPDAAVRSLIELRESIEPVAARLAAEKGSADLRAQLSAAVTGMITATREGSPRDFLDWDLRFHEALVTGSGNELFHTLGRSIRGALEGQTQSGILPVREDSLTIKLHRAIAEAVLAEDGPTAERATRALFGDMRAHLNAETPAAE
ncbi:transcription factor [Streptomyces pilosus]|nr:transcription factor [Streptomyces pilosus]